METPSSSSPVAEVNGIRAALKKLNFRGLNKSSTANCKPTGDEAEDCGSDTHSISISLSSTDNCDAIADVITDSNDVSAGVLLSANNGTCFTPVTDVDGLAMLAAMDEANRRLAADRKAMSPSHRLVGDSVSRQSSMSSSHSTSSNGSGIQSSDNIIVAPDELLTTWRTIVDDCQDFSKRKLELKSLIRRGIPSCFRGTVWALLSGANESPARECYSTYLNTDSPHEKLIRRDVGRTYPEHAMFKEKCGQQSLFNVIKAYSIHDTEVGYCQGIGFIAGLLLMHMSEENAFATLVQVMQEYEMRDFYKPLMAQLGLFMYQFESMIKEYNSELFQHFQKQEFCVTLFASSWFLTLFTLTLPLNISSRIFDIFLSEGMSAVFRAALALLRLCEAELLANDMEGMLKLLQKEVPARLEVEPEQFFTVMFAVKYSSHKMARFEKSYKALKSKETLDEDQIMKLKTENRILRQRITYLETNNIHLPVDLPLDAASQYLTTCYADESRTNQLSKVVKEMRFEEVTANTKKKKVPTATLR